MMLPIAKREYAKPFSPNHEHPVELRGRMNVLPAHRSGICATPQPRGPRTLSSALGFNKAGFGSALRDCFAPLSVSQRRSFFFLLTL